MSLFSRTRKPQPMPTSLVKGTRTATLDVPPDHWLHKDRVITERTHLERELAAFADRGEPGAPDSRVLGAIADVLDVDRGELIRWVAMGGADQTATIEKRIRRQIADELHAVRHRREHQPDTWFWAITHAERVVRGDA